MWRGARLRRVLSQLGRLERECLAVVVDGGGRHRARRAATREDKLMKVRSSLKSLKTRHRDCKLVRRKGVVYVINKTDPRFKAKQG